MTQKILQQGAEAIIYQKGDSITKKRIKKSYRIPELDEKIRKLRTRNEAKLLRKASEIISIPKVIKEDENAKEIVMEFIDGIKLSEELDNFDESQQKEICTEIGKNIAKIHDKGIIHGDLTTSNMIFKNGDVYFIDFGLGFNSNKLEDKAVDMHVLKEALEARHFKNWENLFKWVLTGYQISKEHSNVLKQLEKVEKRGRYKH